MIHLKMILRNEEENRAMNHEEHDGDVLEHLLIEFCKFKYKTFLVGCRCS